MSRASALINKVDGVLKKFGPFQYTVYKRTITRSGGDELTGRKGTVTYTETLFAPQPFFQRLGREHIPGHHAYAQDVLTTTTAKYTVDDYEFLFSPTAISVSDLSTPDVEFVLKDANGNTVDVLRVLDYVAPAMNSTVVVWQVYARSTKRS